MEDCFVVFNPKYGFLKAQRWHKSLDDGIPHHGRYITREKAISAVELYMGKSADNYQQIFESYVINLADPDDCKSPNFALSMVNPDRVINTIQNLLSPSSTGVSVPQLLINLKRAYGNHDYGNTGLKWDPRGAIVLGTNSIKSEEARRMAFAASCSTLFANAYAIASPAYVDIGWFLFESRREAMLFKMACSDYTFETVELFGIVENIKKETKRYLDKFGPKY